MLTPLSLGSWYHYSHPWCECTPGNWGWWPLTSHLCPLSFEGKESVTTANKMRVSLGLIASVWPSSVWGLTNPTGRHRTRNLGSTSPLLSRLSVISVRCRTALMAWHNRQHSLKRRRKNKGARRDHGSLLRGSLDLSFSSLRLLLVGIFKMVIP